MTLLTHLNKVYDVHFALIAGLLFDLKSELIFFIRWSTFVSRMTYIKININ